MNAEFGDFLKKKGFGAKKELKPPLWKGPEEDGITFSLLSRFLVCRERFRLLVIEGLKPHEQWSHKMGYGNMWHTCEEALATGDTTVIVVNGMELPLWRVKLREHVKEVVEKNKPQRDEILKYYEVCKQQFPVYLQHYSKGEKGLKRTPIFQEKVFRVPYKIKPSGREVILCGKFDAVDHLKSPEIQKGLYLQEDKTKGDVRRHLIERQLKFDLQTMIYVVALESILSVDPNTKPPIGDYSKLTDFCKIVPPQDSILHGIRYNVVKRPLSSGKGNIRQHKPTKKKPEGEGKEEYYSRLGREIKKHEDEFFMRWTITLSEEDVERFREECFDPILDQLCYWWDWVKYAHTKGISPFTRESAYQPSLHWRHPFGVWNVLDEGGSSDLDDYIATGSEVGLSRTTNLFPELS